MIKCNQTGQEVNAFSDYLDILSILTSVLVEPQVVDYLNKTWKYKNVNDDSSDHDSDAEEHENEIIIRSYSDDELEAIILIVKHKKIILIL